MANDVARASGVGRLSCVPPVSDAIWRAVSSTPALRALHARRPGRRTGACAPCDRLAGLVALAGDDDDVAGRGRGERGGDGHAAVELDRDRGRTRGEAGEDGIGDRLRILRSRVVGGEHRDVGGVAHRRAHQRALGGVAVAPAPEDAHHPPAGAGQGAGGGQHAAEGIGRVGVVDQHGEGLAGVDPLEAARYDQGLRQPVGDRGEGEAGRRAPWSRPRARWRR